MINCLKMQTVMTVRSNKSKARHQDALKNTAELWLTAPQVLNMNMLVLWKRYTLNLGTLVEGRQYLNDDDSKDDAEDEGEEIGDSVSVDKGDGAVVLQEHGEKDGAQGKHEDTHKSIGHMSTNSTIHHHRQ